MNTFEFDINKFPLDADTINAAMLEEAKRQGIDIGQPPRNEKGQFVSPNPDKQKEGEAKPKEPEETEEAVPEEVIYKLEVELAPGKSMVLSGKSEAEVQAKAEIAQKAVQAAIAKAQEATKTETAPAKKELNAEELFEIGTKLQTGKVEAIEEYLEKSGYLDRYFEKRGIKVSELQDALNKERTQVEAKTWERATEEFKSEHPEYVGSKRNQTLIGYKVAELKNAEPSLEPKEAIERAYLACAEDGLLDTEAAQPAKEQVEETASAAKKPVATKEIVVPKKKATSSSMFGTGAESSTRKATPAQNTARQLTDEQMRKMNPQELADWYNWQVQQTQKR